jgi:hypothetical protein
MALLGLGCAPSRPPDADPTRVTWPDATVPRFAASGRVRFESNRGDIDGRFSLRIDPPHRAWLEVRAGAVFGLVGERVVVSLPGDGWVVTYEERADRIERVAFADSRLADAAPGGGLERLLQVATARLPWPVDEPPPVPRLDGDRLECDLTGAGVPGTLRVEPGGDLLRRLEWRVEGATRLRVEYGEARPCGSGWVPARLRGRAGDLRVDLRLERVVPRDSFADGDFDLDGTSEQGGG